MNLKSFYSLNFLGRLFLSAIFVNAIPGKITNFSAQTNFIVSKGFPEPIAGILLSLAIIILISGSLLLIFTNKIKLGSSLLLIFLIPTTIVFIQPDLGTALVIALGSFSIFWVAGLSYRYFIAGGLLGLLSIPVAWQFLREYQKERVFTFFNPERDPLGNGYHILQSKIALGSGGFFGKGYLDGTQSHLTFFPEMHNDFIFTMFGEEFGFLGSVFLIIIYLIIILLSFRMAIASKSLFSRYLSIGVTFVFSLYVLINISMVMGLIPVVGVPLPFLSYGGSSTLAIMGGFGLLMNCHIHQRTNLEKGDFF